MPPYPKLFRMYKSTCVPILVLLEQFEQLVSYFLLCCWTTKPYSCADFQSLSSPNSSSSKTTTPTAATTPTTTTATPSQISRCITSCAGLESGDYQSCHGCNVYASCWGGGLTDDRPCPASLVWDDIKKRCEYSSPTWWVVRIKMSIVLHPCIYYPM